MYKINDLTKLSVNYAGTKILCAILKVDSLEELRAEMEKRGIDPANDVYDEIRGEFLTLAESKERYSAMAARAMKNRYRVTIATREWAEAEEIQVDSGPKTVRIIYGGQFQVIRGNLMTFASLWDAQIEIERISSGRQYGAWGANKLGYCQYGRVPDRESAVGWNQGQ